MHKKEIAPQIDFADSSYESFEMKNNKLFIYLSSWDDKKIRISFSNPIYFLFRLGSFVSGAFEKADNSAVLNEALLRYYEKVPDPHTFKFYFLEDIEDFAIVEVIAENVTIIKE